MRFCSLLFEICSTYHTLNLQEHSIPFDPCQLVVEIDAILKLFDEATALPGMGKIERQKIETQSFEKQLGEIWQADSTKHSNKDFVSAIKIVINEFYDTDAFQIFQLKKFGTVVCGRHYWVQVQNRNNNKAKVKPLPDSLEQAISDKDCDKNKVRKCLSKTLNLRAIPQFPNVRYSPRSIRLRESKGEYFSPSNFGNRTKLNIALCYISEDHVPKFKFTDSLGFRAKNDTMFPPKKYWDSFAEQLKIGEQPDILLLPELMVNDLASVELKSIAVDKCNIPFVVAGSHHRKSLNDEWRNSAPVWLDGESDKYLVNKLTVFSLKYDGNSNLFDTSDKGERPEVDEETAEDIIIDPTPTFFKIDGLGLVCVLICRDVLSTDRFLAAKSLADHLFIISLDFASKNELVSNIFATSVEDRAGHLAGEFYVNAGFASSNLNSEPLNPNRYNCLAAYKLPGEGKKYSYKVEGGKDAKFYKRRHWFLDEVSECSETGEVLKITYPSKCSHPTEEERQVGIIRISLPIGDATVLPGAFAPRQG